jgi:hypothetical protein
VTGASTYFEMQRGKAHDVLCLNMVVEDGFRDVVIGFVVSKNLV